MKNRIINKFTQISLQYWFLFIALIAGISMILIVPPLQECDGWDHFVRATDVSYGNVLGSFVNLTHEDGVVVVPENLSAVEYHLVDSETGDSKSFAYRLKNMQFSEEKIPMLYDGQVTSIFYWPQGLGIWIGRMLNGSMYTVMSLSRLLNLLCYITP